MKFLPDYMEEQQTNLFKETGSFFAFSDKQFKEQSKEGVVYASLKHGLICPSETVAKLRKGLKTIHEQAMKQDIAENGPEAIILREIYNHESYYTGNPTNALDALKAYNFPNELFVKVWNEGLKQYAIDNY